MLNPWERCADAISMARIHDSRPRVLLAVSDTAVVSLLRETLQVHGGYLCCGWTHKPEKIIPMLKEVRPDIIISTDTLLATKWFSLLLDTRPHIPIVVYSTNTEPKTALHAIQQGASGYLDQADGCAQIPHALKQVLKGELYFSATILTLLAKALGRTRPPTPAVPETTRILIESAAVQATATLTSIDTPLDAEDVYNELTPREQQVIGELAIGRTTKQIGNKLGITEGTVSTYINRIRQKLGIQNREEVLVIAERIMSAQLVRTGTRASSV